MSHKLQKIKTEKAPKAIGPYSQAVSSGQIVFLSGQLPIDPQTGKLIQGDIKAHTNQVLSNLEAVLKAANLSFEHIARMDVFLKNLDDFADMNEEIAKRLTQPVKPARQTIQAAKLPLDAIVEISCIAIRP